MRNLVIALSVVTVSTPAMACPPPLPDTPESIARWQQRIDKFKAHARASSIVYGVMESSLGYNERTRDPHKLGTLRVIRVYRGKYLPGQRIRMRPGAWPLSVCPQWLPLSEAKGAFGVVILNEGGDGKPIRHDGFPPKEWIGIFIAEGIIESAEKSHK